MHFWSIRGTGFIFISNRPSNLQYVDKVIFWEGRKTIEVGSHNELMKLNGVYSEFYNIQSKNIKVSVTEDLMKATGFYLSRYGYVGLNYRNRLAHLSDIKMDEISDTLPHTFFFLYMSVVNGIFIHYCTDSKKSVSERPSAY